MKMNLRRHWFPFFVVGIVALVAFVLPEDKSIQVVAPIIAGLVMFTLASLRHIPDVVIEDLVQEVDWDLLQNELVCSVSGIIVNKSATGSGCIKDIILQVFVDNKKTLDIPISRGIPDIIGFMLHPHGVVPDRMLYFELSYPHVSVSAISGKSAEIHLDVVGQRRRKYSVKMVSISS